MSNCFKVNVTQTNVFFIDEDDFEELGLEVSEDNAKRIASEHRIWDEHQSGDDTFCVDINVEEHENNG